MKYSHLIGQICHFQGKYMKLADRLRRSGLGGFFVGFELSIDRSQQLPVWMVVEG
jgi:hypothetical protein